MARKTTTSRRARPENRGAPIEPDAAALAAMKLATQVASIRAEVEAAEGNGGGEHDDKDLAEAVKHLEGAFRRLWAIATRHTAVPPPPSRCELANALEAVGQGAA